MGKLSKEFVELVNKNYPISSFRAHLKSLEISCHGLPWLFIAIAGLYTSSSPFFFNLLLALLLDIAVVAVVKAFTRRRRPAYNVDDQYATVKMVDKFSFPSGHSTRAVMLAIMFALVEPVNMILWLPLLFGLEPFVLVECCWGDIIFWMLLLESSLDLSKLLLWVGYGDLRSKRNTSCPSLGTRILGQVLNITKDD